MRYFWLIWFLSLPMLALATQHDRNHSHFNSLEPGCNPLSPAQGYLICDDAEDRSCTGSVSDGEPDTDGWIKNPWTNDPLNQKFARWGNLGANGTDSTCTSAPIAGTGPESGGGWMIKSFAPTDTIYARWYYRYLPGYRFGHQKDMLFQGHNAQFMMLFHAWGGTSVAPSILLVAEDRWLNQNQGNTLASVPGNWYAIEIGMRLNTPGQSDGVIEMWLDNCGANGRGCTMVPTLRLRHTGLRMRSSPDRMVNNIWLDSYARAPSSGEHYRDQIIVATRRIGWMGQAVPRDPDPVPPPPVLDPRRPRPPTNFRYEWR